MTDSTVDKAALAAKGLAAWATQLFCSHDWRMNRFQALIDDGTCDVTCIKCGKQSRAGLDALSAHEAKEADNG